MVSIWALFTLKIFEKLRMSEKCHNNNNNNNNNNNSNNPLALRHTNGGKNKHSDKVIIQKVIYLHRTIIGLISSPCRMCIKYASLTSKKLSISPGNILGKTIVVCANKKYDKHSRQVAINGSGALAASIHPPSNRHLPVPREREGGLG